MATPQPEGVFDAYGESLGDRGDRWDIDGFDTTDTARRLAFLDRLRQSRDPGDLEGDDPLDLGILERYHAPPPRLDPKFADAPPGTLQDAGHVGKRRRVAERLDYITQEDFEEGAERDAFKLIYGFAVALFGTNATPESRAQAIEFFFCDSPDHFSFLEAAMAISPTIRTDVVLLRFQYEFWRRYDIFAEPFPFISSLPVPPRVVNAAAFAGSDIGMLAPRNMWLQPGIHINTLIAEIGDELDMRTEAELERILNVINQMTDAYLFSRKGDSLYVTLRNPELEQEEWAAKHRVDSSRSKIWWTRLF